jgi:putative sigma-54 modulation protein
VSLDVIVRGKNMEVTEALRDHVTRKLSKLAKHFDHEPVTAEALMWVEKDRQIIEVTVPVEGGRLLRGEEETPDMYASVDLVVDKLERQLNKLKARVRPRSHASHERMAAAAPPDEGALVRQKTFPVKPMAVDEAILQMEMLGHDFFAFANAESQQINVVYRRKDGNYGLLEPR